MATSVPGGSTRGGGGECIACFVDAEMELVAEATDAAVDPSYILCELAMYDKSRRLRKRMAKMQIISDWSTATTGHTDDDDNDDDDCNNLDTSVK
mmetsp:Transcript_20188/g.43789  ORF Transcript_20188/g.43789 Transcript_20188/m.43789 type:complete len:95 (-) Transcript_20188:1150-1434(-)